jgi:hypothetical protein
VDIIKLCNNDEKVVNYVLVKELMKNRKPVYRCPKTNGRNNSSIFIVTLLENYKIDFQMCILVSYFWLLKFKVGQIMNLTMIL